MAKQKIYLVEWKDSWYLPKSDMVKAKDKEYAWRKIKRRHPFSTNQIVSVTEV